MDLYQLRSIIKQRSFLPYSAIFIIFVFTISVLFLPILVLMKNQNTVYATHDDVNFTVTNYTVGDGPGYDMNTGPVAADFDQDGNLDMAMISSGAGLNGNRVAILIGNGDGTFDPSVYYTVANEPHQAAVSDLNGDDFPDIVTSSWPGMNISVLINDGDGTFAAKVDYSSGDNMYSKPRIVDLNNDDFLDIVVTSYAQDRISVFIGNGDGTFDPVVKYSVADSPYDFVIADFNEDDYLDIATSSGGSGDSTSVLINDGDGTFAAAVNYPVGNSPYMAINATDYNNDDNIDLALANDSDDTVSVLMGNGDGTFDAKVDYSVSNNPYGLSSIDVNHDDYVDIIASTYTSPGIISVLINDGDGTFAAAVNYTVGNSTYNHPVTESLNDFNNDGNVDLVAANYGSGTLSVLLGVGDGTFDAAENFTVGSQPEGIVLSEDFNEDGLADIAVANYATDNVSVLLNTTPVPDIGFSATTGSGSETLPSVDIPVLLSTTTDTDVEIGYAVTGGTATSGSDYVLVSGTLTIPAGETSGNIILTLLNDSINEGSETVVITLSSPVSALLDGATDEFIYTILNNGSPASSSGSSNSSDSDDEDPIEYCPGQTDPIACNTPLPVTPGSGIDAPTNPVETFIRNLGLGSVGEDVRKLQQFLNQNNFILAPSGNGSPGKETNYYGPRTTNAIVRFQEYYKDQILTPLNLSNGTGYFGEKTRGFINSMIN